MIIHNLFAYFTKTLTVPKIKDLVNAPAEKYNHIFDIISSQSATSTILGITGIADNNSADNNSADNSTNISELATINKGELNSMKNELKNFLKKQFKNDPYKNDVLPQQHYQQKEYSPAY
jgi:hypothetical protein